MATTKKTTRHYEYPCNGYAIRHDSGCWAYRVEHPVNDTEYYSAHSLKEARGIALALPTLYGKEPDRGKAAPHVFEEEFYLTNGDAKVFDDENSHRYDCTCFDGFAICTRAKDEPDTSPAVVWATYPKLSEVQKDGYWMADILEYRGVPPTEKVHFGDIMLSEGEVVAQLP